MTRAAYGLPLARCFALTVALTVAAAHAHAAPAGK